jgi:hypothetical protein
MKTSRRIVKLLPVLALLALAPFMLLNCDSGDEADGPTGPDSAFHPGVNPQSPGLTAKVYGTPTQGGKFTIVAWYNTAKGTPVEGQEIYIQAEDGTAPAAGYFTFDTNPTVTGANGGASIGVNVDGGTPAGSYTFVLWEGPKPDVKAYAHIQVGTSLVASISSVTVTTSTPVITVASGANAIFTVTAAANSLCTVNMTYSQLGSADALVTDAVVPGAGNPRTFPIASPFLAGNLIVTAKAWCAETPTVIVTSSVDATVTVNP